MTHLRKLIVLDESKKAGGAASSLHFPFTIPERRELLHDVNLEAPDHDLVLEQQVQLVGVLGAPDERDAVDGPVLCSLRSPAHAVVKSSQTRPHSIR